MTDREEEDECWRELQRFATYAAIRAWALRRGLPNPSYDPKIGWSLDQLAMRFERDLLQEYKKVMAALHRPSRKKRDGYRWIGVGSQLTANLKSYLLDPRFRVEGFRLGAYEPTVIPRPLLEGM